MFDKRDKVVYFHIAKEDFEVDGKFFKQGQVVYVGSGHKRRMNEYAGRSTTHSSIWDKLDFELKYDNLTLEESQNKEQELINSLWEFGLLNKNKKVNIKTNYKYNDLSEIFYLDSNDNLRWKVDIYRKNGGILKQFKDQLVIRNTEKAYPKVIYKHRVYATYRVIWCLYHKKDIASNFVIDHIDRNPCNNTPSNLRISSYSDNNLNKEHKIPNSEHKYIHYSESRKCYLVRPHKLFLKFKNFLLNPLLKLGYSLEDAKIIKLKEAIEYRDSIIDIM